MHKKRKNHRAQLKPEYQAAHYFLIFQYNRQDFSQFANIRAKVNLIYLIKAPSLFLIDYNSCRHLLSRPPNEYFQNYHHYLLPRQSTTH